MADNIVVTLDGSALAEKILPIAITLAKKTGQRIVLLRLVPDADNPAELSSAKSYMEEVYRQITLPELQTRIDPAKVEVKVQPGKATDLAATIAGLDASLVMMTTHGRTGLSRLVVGSVARDTLEQLDVPFILLRPTDTVDSQLPMEMMYLHSDTPGPQNTYSGQIVATLDGSSDGEAVLEPAANLARSLGFTLCLLQVVFPRHPISEGVNFASAEDLAKRQRGATQYLQKVQQQVAAKGVNCITQVLTGEPDQEVVNYARYNGVALIAMATHTKSRLGRIIMGSVAEKVMDATHLPVLMVHPS